jgi:hypothetical protein
MSCVRKVCPLPCLLSEYQNTNERATKASQGSRTLSASNQDAFIVSPRLVPTTGILPSPCNSGWQVAFSSRGCPRSSSSSNKKRGRGKGKARRGGLLSGLVGGSRGLLGRPCPPSLLTAITPATTLRQAFQ